MGKYCKTVLINRAVPGSGKTTFSKRIYDAVRGAGLSIAVHSTDEFFMVGNRYEFELEKLGEYHKRNLENFTGSLRKGIDLVVVDNTNLKPWECEPYTQAARGAGYKIVLFNFLPREFEKHLASQQITPEKPDAHQVSAELLKRFISEFHLYNDLLNRNFVPDPKVHINCVWDDETMQLKKVDSLVHHFDYDDIVVVNPHEYHTLKETIGDVMLEKMRSQTMSEDEIIQVCRELVGKTVTGRVTSLESGWLMVQLNEVPFGVRAYLPAKSIRQIELVDINDIVNRELCFTARSYHEYDKTIELQDGLMYMDKCSKNLQTYINETLESKRHQLLCSLKVGDVVSGTVKGPSCVDIGYGMEVPFQCAEWYKVLGAKVDVEVLAVDRVMGNMEVGEVKVKEEKTGEVKVEESGDKTGCLVAIVIAVATVLAGCAAIIR